MSERPLIITMPTAADRRRAALPALAEMAMDTVRSTIGVMPRRRALFVERFSEAYGDTP
jgi:hypothetical protein